jgi:hypothetical protein
LLALPRGLRHLSQIKWLMTELPPLDGAVLPPDIRARFVENVNGLRMHVLAAGFETPGRPCLLLLENLTTSPQQKSQHGRRQKISLCLRSQHRGCIR